MLNKQTNLYASARDGSQFPGERADCVVRALSLAANRPYAEIHALCAQHGREYGRGTSGDVVIKSCRALGGIGVPIRGWSDAYVTARSGPTLAEFIRRHPKGRFYLNKRGHGFALIDGVVHDWNGTSGPRTRVTLAYQFS